MFASAPPILSSVKRLWPFNSVGHCSKFGYALQATAADLVIPYGPLHGMKLYSKNLLQLPCYWPMAQDFVMCCSLYP